MRRARRSSSEVFAVRRVSARPSVAGADGAFTDAGQLVGPGRFYHATITTPAGDVLVVGGLALGVVASVDELTNGQTAFHAAPDLAQPAQLGRARADQLRCRRDLGLQYYSPSAGGQLIPDVLCAMRARARSPRSGRSISAVAPASHRNDARRRHDRRARRLRRVRRGTASHSAHADCRALITACVSSADASRREFASARWTTSSCDRLAPERRTDF